MIAETTRESVAFSEFLMSLQLQEDDKPGGDANVAHFLGCYPGLIAGVGAFIAGLSDAENVAAFKFDLENFDKATALRNYLRKATLKGVAAGLIDRYAWAAVDQAVDSLMQTDIGQCFVDHAHCGRVAQRLGSIVIVGCWLTLSCG